MDVQVWGLLLSLGKFQEDHFPGHLKNDNKICPPPRHSNMHTHILKYKLLNIDFLFLLFEA
jgi:hypothetical protein